MSEPKAIPGQGLRWGMPADAPAVAALHAERIGEGFLVTLGHGFLHRLYARVARSRRAFVLVAEDAEGLIGFSAIAEDTGALYREFLLRDGVAAGLAAVRPLLRSWRRAWETLRYGFGAHATEGTAPVPDQLPKAEVLSIAVARRAAGRGLGRALVSASTAELLRRGIESARVVTRVDNAAALALYEGCGFRRRTRTQVHAGIPQEVLVWP